MLRIGGNNDIGDAGTVALAAALRMAGENDNDRDHILEELDLSSCNVGDAGAEALALAMASSPNCLRRLDLSNNKITDAGSKALGRALVDARHISGTTFEELILDNNDVGNEGAAALADAFACGAVKSISLRSLSVRAQGTAAFGKAIVSLANLKNRDESTYLIDLSGNHFGTLIKKKKGAMHSASLIRDRAGANIKFIGKTLKGAAKRFGSEAMGITADSDDDEEAMGGVLEEEEEEVDGNKLQTCGGYSFAGEVLTGEFTQTSTPLKITVGMRQCCLDDGAIDAMAAAIVGAKNCEISMDVSMSAVEEEEVVDALMEAKKDSKLLKTMAQRHMDLLQRIEDAAERAAARVQELGFDDDIFDAVDFDYEQPWSDDYD